MAKDDSRKPALFDDSDDESDGGAQLKVNSEYARRFEHNKKREEQHRLEEKHKSSKAAGAKGKEAADSSDSDSDSSSDETEDETGFLATEELDAQLNATLEAIKKKDPRLYDGKTTFYSPIDDATVVEAGLAKAKKEKPVTIHDYHRQRILEGDTGKDFGTEDEPPKTYVQEQADLQKSIRDEIAKQMNGEDQGQEESEDDNDDFIKAKSKQQRHIPDVVEEAAAESSVHPSRARRVKTPAASVPDISTADKDPELFLSNFMSSRAWVQEEGPKWDAFESDDGEDVGNDKADEWEAAYNLRFEDPSKSNEVLKTYARDVTASRSVRREEKSSRKRQREEEAQAKATAKQQRKEERARLRHLKINEAEDKLKKIKKAAGMSGKALRDEDWKKLLDAGWDNDQWEEEMQKHFNDEYYAEADADWKTRDAESDDDEKPKSKPKKPTWDDDIDIKDLVPDFEDDEAPPKANLSDIEQEDEDEDEDEDGPASKRQKTTKDRKKERLQSQKEARQERAKLEAIVDAHMNIEDPEILGGASSSKTEAQSLFRYRETKPESFGLTTRDILMASDAALNQFVGLKKLAHFRPDDKKAKDKKRLGKKARLRQWRKDTFGPEFEREPPAFNPGTIEEPALAANDNQEASGNNIIESGKKKRKRSRNKKGGEAAA